MYRDGHAGFNALLYAPVLPVATEYWSFRLALVGTVVALGVATLPDFDDPLPWIEHRGPTHTVWFATVVGALAGLGTALTVPGTPGAFAFGAAVGTAGVLAHLAGDIVTPMGISPFAPVWRTHVSLGWFYSKNPQVNRSFLLAGSVALGSSLGIAIWGL